MEEATLRPRVAATETVVVGAEVVAQGAVLVTAMVPALDMVKEEDLGLVAEEVVAPARETAEMEE